MVIKHKVTTSEFVQSDTNRHGKMQYNSRSPMGNNPMVGATVAVAVAIEEATKA